MHVIVRPFGAFLEAMLRSDGGQHRAAGGGIDREQLDAVYRLEAPRLRQLLKRKIWLEDERNDIVQEAFARLAASTSGAARYNPGAYLQGIVRHLLADRVRNWVKTRSVDPLDFAVECEPLGPDTAAEISEMRERYRAAVDALPPKTREVYLLHRGDDLGYKQIAEQLGISIRTVEWHVAQAIIRIGKSISTDG